jgi:hypothetical protein
MTEQSIEMKIAGPHPGLMALTVRPGETWEERMERRFKDMSLVLTPEHPYWYWFIMRLYGSERTDWDDDNDRVNCDTTQKHTRKILKRMARLKHQDARLDFDIEKTLDCL